MKNGRNFVASAKFQGARILFFYMAFMDNCKTFVTCVWSLRVVESV